jgi:hypothetical protein
MVFFYSAVLSGWVRWYIGIICCDVISNCEECVCQVSTIRLLGSESKIRVNQSFQIGRSEPGGTRGTQ